MLAQVIAIILICHSCITIGRNLTDITVIAIRNDEKTTTKGRSTHANYILSHFFYLRTTLIV